MPGTCTRAGQTLHCRIPPLWLNDTYELSLPLAVSASGGTGTFAATLATHETETAPANNNFSLAINGSELAVLALGVASNANAYALVRGESTTITWSVGNQGPSPSTLTTLDVQIPPGLNVTGHTTTRGTCAAGAGVFHCDLGTLNVAIAAIITIDLLAATPGSRDIVGHADGAGFDSGVLHDHFTHVIVRAVGDVSVALAESADPIQVGTSFDYTATVSNISGDASSVHVTVPVTGARVSLAATSSGTCTRRTRRSIATSPTSPLAPAPPSTSISTRRLPESPPRLRRRPTEASTPTPLTTRRRSAPRCASSAT